MTDTDVMTDTAEIRLQELTALIDSFIPNTINRNLIQAMEFQNFLLDARQILNRQN